MTEFTVFQNILIWTLPVLFAVTLHEVAHGWVASLFGDQTARLSGRLSLNPIKHIDPMGTIFVPLFLMVMTQFRFIFGWAKPVPVDSRNMRHPKRDMALVALAGPLANILMAFAWGLVAKIGVWGEARGLPLLGFVYMGAAGIQINVLLGVLNLIPLPPLDGGNILCGILSPQAAYQFRRIEPYGFAILLLLMISGVLSAIMMPFVMGLTTFIGGIFGLI